MPRITIVASLLPMFFAACFPASAQLTPAQPDPLARIRQAAQGNTQACSATGETLCEQVAPKIIANAQGESPLAENLRRLTREITQQKAGAKTGTVSWAVAAFEAAGVDVRTEKDAVPSTGQVQEIVVGEIRGREKPDEWVLLGAHLDSSEADAVDAACNAALVIEAARDIQLTGIRPRRSIRFVLFTGARKDMFGSWAYVHAHHDELDRARAAIIFDGGAARMTGYTLYGRRDIEPGLREALKPIESWKIGYNASGPPSATDNFDFLLEGIPTILAGQDGVKHLHVSATLHNADIQELKRNTEIAAVTAFGIAERADPLGPRQSRSQIESLLKSTGLGQNAQGKSLWPLWESGQRGRSPE